jgi:hypothetical protein
LLIDKNKQHRKEQHRHEQFPLTFACGGQLVLLFIHGSLYPIIGVHHDKIMLNEKKKKALHELLVLQQQQQQHIHRPGQQLPNRINTMGQVCPLSTDKTLSRSADISIANKCRKKESISNSNISRSFPCGGQVNDQINI